MLFKKSVAYFHNIYAVFEFVKINDLFPMFNFQKKNCQKVVTNDLITYVKNNHNLSMKVNKQSRFID